jgi:tryptophan 2,3-dioxygenase
MEKSLYYNEYLHLDKILQSQYPKSFYASSDTAHDEMLFIIIHQTYELWFKQILFELDYIQRVFAQQNINDNDDHLNLVRHRLYRIIRILELLNQQVTVLETMTPLDFLEFRNALTPSSGFQSLQFRLIEARLGLDLQQRHHHCYYKRTNEGGLNENDFNTLNKVEKTNTLLQQVNNWLERLPFWDLSFWSTYNSTSSTLHPFWELYRTLYQQSLVKKEINEINDFDFIFFNIKNHPFTEEQQKALQSPFSNTALQAALFIMLYRDLPYFQTAYQILDSLIMIDHWMASWRHKHLLMVKRMIGMRVGTGNTSGAGYLDGALQKHFIYKDIASLSTFLIERNKLPKLPNALIQHLSFHR